MKRRRLFAFVMAFAAVCLIAQNKSASKKSDIAGNWINAWNSHDPDKLIAVFTSDVVYEDVPFGAINHGSAELRKFAEDEFASVPDLKVELLNSSIQADHGTIEWKFSGTDKGIYKTGKEFSVRGVSVIEINNGRVSRNVDYYDAATLMKQVGVLPAGTEAN